MARNMPRVQPVQPNDAAPGSCRVNIAVTNCDQVESVLRWNNVCIFCPLFESTDEMKRLLAPLRRQRNYLPAIFSISVP